MGHTQVIDLGEYGPGFTENPHPVYAELRERGPVHRVRLPKHDAHHEVWLVVGYEEARAALADPRLSKDGSKVRRLQQARGARPWLLRRRPDARREALGTEEGIPRDGSQIPTQLM